ncbi:leucine-rich repeat flightless-interacting protein 2 isoform X2 [Plutella xylostella]|uniref:leucine-rich repeat flightless-interacting protein 2 isoform X2 n=1 Tax=Plutella xylostella TaxID=51655 RepID=UPI002032D861|nr:leucine-rich repeat flightless-interacting protein 2 isoform X2 [Plutella xylostella]
MVRLSLAMVVGVAPALVSWVKGQGQWLVPSLLSPCEDKSSLLSPCEDKASLLSPCEDKAPRLAPRRSPSLSDCLESSSDEESARSIVCHVRPKLAEQRLAARRAARAEAREIRMRELERQQREQENNADKAYDMYAGKTETAVRRGGARLAALAPGLHSPRRSSEDSVDDSFSLKDLRHELKEVSEKFRAAMILNAQLDNDKAALRYQLEQLRDQAEEQREAAAQLQREHKEKCSAHERLKREHASLDRELLSARDAILARDAAAAAAGRAFVEATGDVAELAGSAVGSVPALALVSRESEEMLNDAGEGTLDVRLQKLVTSRQELEAEVRRLKLQLNDERAARVNGASGQDCESDLEVTRKSLAEAKARAARAEAEAALQGAAVARLEAQVARLRARQEGQDEHEHALKQERRRLQREAREALNRVEELETENNHLTKRLDKLKNAKSALLKEL